MIRRNLLLAGLGLLAIHAPWCLAQDTPTKRPEPPPQVSEPIVIQVDPLQVDGPLEITHQVAVSEQQAKLFGKENPIQWAPPDVQPPLASIVQTPEVNAETLPLGAAGSGAIVEFSVSRAPLRGDQPGVLTLRIAHPEKLPPGIFAGRLQTTMSCVLTSGVIKQHWPIVLIVRGRRVVQADFQHLPLRVGSPASLRAVVQTVDCGPGQGRLRLNHYGGGAEGKLLELPLPLEGPHDFLVHQEKLKTPACPEPFLARQWQREAIAARARRQFKRFNARAAVKIGATKVPDVSTTVHLFEVSLPDCFALGRMEASVDWQAEPQDQAGATTTAITSAVIESGIRVSPRVAFVGEPLTIHVVSQSDLGDSLPLVVHGRGKQHTARVVAEKAAADRQSRAGQVDYRATYVPPDVTGPFEVQLAARPDDRGAVALPGRARFHVLFQRSSSLQSGPLVVFPGPQPFWWDWQGTAASWENGRAGAFVFRDRSNSLRDASVTLHGVFRVSPDRPPALIAPDAPAYDQEPVLTISNAAAGEKAISHWELGANNLLKLDVAVSLKPEESSARFAARHQTGQRHYVMRMLVQGVRADGESVYRLLDVPVQVRVADLWADFYQPAITWLSAGLAFLLVLVIGCRRYTRAFRAPKSSSAGQSQPISEEPEQAGSLIPRDAAQIQSAGSGDEESKDDMDEGESLSEEQEDDQATPLRAGDAQPSPSLIDVHQGGSETKDDNEEFGGPSLIPGR